MGLRNAMVSQSFEKFFLVCPGGSVVVVVVIVFDM